MARNFIVLDTETAPVVKMKDCNAENMRVYDIGWIVADSNGKPIVKRSFVVSEIFYNEAMMKSAYYAEKLPQYYEGIKAGEWEVKSLAAIREIFKNDCAEYGVKKVWAFNARFDMVALNETVKALSNNFVKWFLPYGVKWFDIMPYASSTIGYTKKYATYCLNNNYMTKNDSPQVKAEVFYRYLTKNNDFQERHTALSDCEIELFILNKSKSRKQKACFQMGAGYKYPKEKYNEIKM